MQESPLEIITTDATGRSWARVPNEDGEIILYGDEILVKIGTDYWPEVIEEIE